MVYYRRWSPWLCEWVEYHELKWWMKHLYVGYRHQHVQQERRRWYKDCEEDIKLRRRRAPCHLEVWGELEKYPSCIEMRSWKKLSKCKKQYQKNL